MALRIDGNHRYSRIKNRRSLFVNRMPRESESNALIRRRSIVAPMLIKGAMNGEAFQAYIEQCLVPTLKRGDIVVVDNVPFHKVAGADEAIRSVGASLRYLPKYSPDLNPIELAFHPLKAFLRKAAQRTIDGLRRCVSSYIGALDPSEGMAYVRHSGYEPS
jgi:transposase